MTEPSLFPPRFWTNLTAAAAAAASATFTTTTNATTADATAATATARATAAAAAPRWLPRRPPAGSTGVYVVTAG